MVEEKVYLPVTAITEAARECSGDERDEGRRQKVEEGRKDITVCLL